MTYQELLEYCGTAANISKLCNITSGAVAQWKTNNRVPLSRQWEIELKTKGKLKAEKVESPQCQ